VRTVETREFSGSIDVFPQPARQHARFVALITTNVAIGYLERLTDQTVASLLNVSLERQAIPNRDALDKILRYEAMVERARDRALDRLERLQRRRQGELVPPALNVRLTQ
jgi:hypothetical protein